MKERLEQAAKDGIVLGVKYLLVILIIVFGSQDYLKTRQMAVMGNAARDYIYSGIVAGKLPQQWPAPPAPVATPVESPVAATRPLPVPFVSPSPAK